MEISNQVNEKVNEVFGSNSRLKNDIYEFTPLEHLHFLCVRFENEKEFKTKLCNILKLQMDSIANTIREINKV